MSAVDQVHEGMAPWAKRALVVILLIVVLVGAGLLGAAFLPRWWAHRVGAQAGGGGVLPGVRGTGVRWWLGPDRYEMGKKHARGRVNLPHSLAARR